MKRASLPILALALVAPLAGASEWTACGQIITPEDELSFARQFYREGTNFTARGMFREAEDRIGGGIGNATGHLRELEQRAAGIETLRALADQSASIWDEFQTDWTNAGVRALALEEPIKAFVASNPVVKEPLERRLKSFDWLRDELAANDRRNASANIRNTRDALRDQIKAFEELQRLEPGFRAVLADLERAREELKVERAKPLDVERALRIAREYLDAANAKIKAPGSRYVGADWDMKCAGRYLNDVRQTGESKDGLAEVEASLAETKRAWTLAGVRYNLDEARNWLAKDRPDNAKGYVDHAENIYLCDLKGDPVFDDLSELVGELKQTVEQMIADDEHAKELASIAKRRKELGDPDAPVLPDVLLAPEDKSEEGIRRFAAETDFAAILAQEFSETNIDLSVYRRATFPVCFPNDTNFIPTIRSAMLRAVNTNYPATFYGGERFTICISAPIGSDSYPYFARTRTVDGKTIKEVVPFQRYLHLARTSAQPDDLFLYFETETDDLFTPGGRTVLIPGLGAYLAEKLPHDWLTRQEPKPHFKGQEEPKPPRRPPPYRCFCNNPSAPHPDCTCGCKERFSAKCGRKGPPVAGRPAPERPNKTLLEQLEKLDIAANVTNRLDDDFIRLSINREGKRIDVPTNDWNEVFATLRGTVETKFPDDLSGGERFRLLLVLSETEDFVTLTETGADGKEIRHVKPGIGFLDMIRFSGNRDDAYLDFTGPFSELFTPGGKTAIIPGFGALLDRILPPFPAPDSAPSAD